MRILSVLSALLLASGAAGTARGADLTKIDRTIQKEPAYQGKPQYCLLVFGPEAKTRVWLVRDGKILYVDRNRNGDLTAKGNAVTGKHKQNQSEFVINELHVADTKPTHGRVVVRFTDSAASLRFQVQGHRAVSV